MVRKSFASDNCAGIHPSILKAIADANQGHEKAYSHDTYTYRAIELFKNHFGNDIDVSFVGTGTAANVLGLSALLRSYQGIICAESAHINTSECGALENYTGSKLLPVPTKDGKLTLEGIQSKMVNLGNPHRVQPKVISITQVTELGTFYTPDEIQKITKFAHAYDMYVHMDGARLSNAAVCLNASFASITKDVGVDLLSFGGTKNGLMIGDAVIFFNKELAKDFAHVRQQGTHRVSKMRFIAAQFIALLTDDLWRKNAQHANAMAQLLADEIKKIPQIKLSREVQANAVFAIVDPKIIPLLQEQFYFHVWNEITSEVRWMTAWDITQEDVAEFVALIKKTLAENKN